MMPATPQQAEKKAEAAAEQAKRRGASPGQVEAIKLETYARERGAVVEPVTTTADGRSASVTLRGEEHTGFRLSNGKDTALIDYSAGLDAVSDFLGDSPARDLGMQYVAQVMTIQQKSQQAFNDGYNRGFVSSVRSGVRAQQQQQLHTSRQLSAMEQRRLVEIQQTGTFGDFAYGVVTGGLDAISQGLQVGAQLLTKGPAGMYMDGVQTFSFLDAPATKLEAAGRFSGEVLASLSGGGALGTVRMAGSGNTVQKLATAIGTSERRAFLNNKYGRTGELHVDINIRGNRETAVNSYKAAGYSDRRMESHLNGIDFSKSVEVVKVGRGQHLYQWDAPTNYRGGEYFAVSVNSTPTQLGINPSKLGFGTNDVFTRLQTPLVTNRSVYGLRSTAASINDYWSVPRQPFMTKGGAKQLFTPDSAAFKLNSTAYFGY